jgi:hypothetical protein
VAGRLSSAGLAARTGAVSAGCDLDFDHARRRAALLADGIRRGGAPCCDRCVQRAAAGRQHKGTGWYALWSIAVSQDSVIPGNGHSGALQPFSPAAAPAPGSSSVGVGRTGSLGALRTRSRVRDTGGRQRLGDMAAGDPYGWPYGWSLVRRSRFCGSPSSGRSRTTPANSPQRSRQQDSPAQ